MEPLTGMLDSSFRLLEIVDGTFDRDVGLFL